MLSAREAVPQEGFEEFLNRDLRKDLLRFTTAGSVDDGKSTLIGRLLHDSKAVYEDQLAAVRKSRINRSGRAIDFSLLTDGLRAEREQGITIDVAYRYFSTSRRKFIIADTPGHEQYTRNMATGASTADLAIILVDATKGLLEQTNRHAYIASLLGIPNVVAAINKMDLAGYDEKYFLAVKCDFIALAESLRISSVQCIPISALEGDNVVTRSQNMPWYDGPTLIEHLESVAIAPPQSTEEFRFAIQSVIRPNAAFRGFAGRVASGVVRPGDEILALPSRLRTRVQSVVSYQGDLDAAVPSQSVVLKLADEIDLSRGDMLVSPYAPPLVSNRFAAMVVWLDAQPLALGASYWLKHAGRLVKAQIRRIRFRVNTNDLTEHPARRLEMNEIASVELETNSSLFFDAYSQNRMTGSFILIDTLSNATVGAGMIQDESLLKRTDSRELEDAPVASPPVEVLPQERIERHGHPPALFFLGSSVSTSRSLERNLFERDFEVIHVRGERIPSDALHSALSALWSIGSIILYSTERAESLEREACQAVAGDHLFDFAENASEDDQILQDALDVAERLRSEFRARKWQEED